MARITCSKGHVYDSAVYGDNCPFCPSEGATVANFGGSGGDTSGNFNDGGGGTQVNPSIGGGDNDSASNMQTIAMGGANYGGGVGGGTMIRPADGGSGTGMPIGRKIMGVLATYNTNPQGQVFHIYEGRNYVGRDPNSEINIQGDKQVSAKHFSILYRAVDGKFKFKDEQSSNGTFLNEELTDEGELTTFDVIRIGSTKLIFIAIPQIQ